MLPDRSRLGLSHCKSFLALRTQNVQCSYSYETATLKVYGTGQFGVHKKFLGVAHNETLFSAPIFHLPKCLIHSLGVFSIDETSMSTDMLIPELLGSSVPVTC